jgi:hypothetical protein
MKTVTFTKVRNLTPAELKQRGGPGGMTSQNWVGDPKLDIADLDPAKCRTHWYCRFVVKIPEPGELAGCRPLEAAMESLAYLAGDELSRIRPMVLHFDADWVECDAPLAAHILTYPPGDPARVFVKDGMYLFGGRLVDAKVEPAGRVSLDDQAVVASFSQENGLTSEFILAVRERRLGKFVAEHLAAARRWEVGGERLA